MSRLVTLLLFLLLSSCQSPSISICSWNLKDFGNSKSDQEIAFIAKKINDFDVVAIQEVVTSREGIMAVERLIDALSQSGKQWECAISEPTSSSAYKTERYAFLWKTKRVRKIGNAWLERKYSKDIDREPYFITLQIKGKTFTLVNFHAITKKMKPETEIKYFKYFPDEYPSLRLLFCGDFNLPQSHSVFNPLKEMGYYPALLGQKTSLRDRCLEDGCLASEYDNFFFNRSNIELLDKGIIHFYESFVDFNDARKISDHVPIFINIKLKSN